MKRLPILLVAALAVLALAHVAEAQTVTNPTKVTFAPVAAEHPAVTKYSIAYFLGSSVEPVQETDLGTGALDANGDLTLPINSRPLAFGVYTAKVRAWAGAVAGEWSDPSNPFQRVPGKPGKPAW